MVGQSRGLQKSLSLDVAGYGFTTISLSQEES